MYVICILCAVHIIFPPFSVPNINCSRARTALRLLMACFLGVWITTGVVLFVRLKSSRPNHLIKLTRALILTAGNVSRDQLAKEPLRVKQQFDEWVNISSFIARCMEHRIEVDFPGAGKYQSIDICNGLREEHPAGIERDTYVMVAAQYILLALTFIDDRVVAFTAKQGAMNLGRDKFQLWGAKLAQLANDGDLRPDVKAAVIEARQKLVSLHPEFFEG